MKKLFSMGLKYDSGLFILDQEKLPHEEIWLECKSPSDMSSYIKSLKVRGAPLIGVAAALALAQYVESGASVSEISSASKLLRESRPTAVNLMAAIDRMMSSESKVKMAEMIFDEDVALCEAMGKNGEPLINDGDGILTHCNTGGLATVGIGTALGVIRKAHEARKKIHVYVDETRPLFQGARLTTWELKKLGIPHTLICDNMAAMLMKKGKVQKIFVGSDRIAKNGDFANKIGTYGVAVLAAHHKIPFYVVAPSTTVDAQCAGGDLIPIEERAASEVRFPLAPKDCDVFNPAFDVTPHELVTGYVLDKAFLNKFIL